LSLFLRKLRIITIAFSGTGCLLSGFSSFSEERSLDSFFNEILGLATDFIAEFQYIPWYFISGVALEAIVRT